MKLIARRIILAMLIGTLAASVSCTVSAQRPNRNGSGTADNRDGSVYTPRQPSPYEIARPYAFNIPVNATARPARPAPEPESTPQPSRRGSSHPNTVGVGH